MASKALGLKGFRRRSLQFQSVISTLAASAIAVPLVVDPLLLVEQPVEAAAAPLLVGGTTARHSRGTPSQ